MDLGINSYWRFSILVDSFDYEEKSLITVVSVHKISTGSSAENFFLFSKEESKHS